MSKPDYSITESRFTQPVTREKKDSATFEQRVKLLLPPDESRVTKVLFIMGLEATLDDKWLTAPYEAFGARKDMAVLCAEHRGYGASVYGDSQKCPDYVDIGEALADYHELRRAFSDRFPCTWILYGCSYGGGLVINYAHEYPDDAKAAICSSGVVDWNALLPEYDEAARENLGAELYERLCRHIDALTPAVPFDENWRGRELICAFVTGLCQYREYQGLLGLVNSMAKLPTKGFISAMKLADRLFSGSAAHDYATSNSAAELSAKQAKTGRWAWRVWRYQQAFQTGTYWAACGERSIYRRTAEDWKQESKLLFGREATVFEKGTGWDVRAMIPQLKLPLIYVRGDRDPWRRVGLEADYPLKSGKVITIEGGFHGPDRYPDTGKAVFEETLRIIKED